MKKAIVFQQKSKFIATFLLLPHFSYKYLPEIQKLSRHFPNFQFILFEERVSIVLGTKYIFSRKAGNGEGEAGWLTRLPPPPLPRRFLRLRSKSATLAEWGLRNGVEGGGGDASEKVFSRKRKQGAPLGIWQERNGVMPPTVPISIVFCGGNFKMYGTSWF